MAEKAYITTSLNQKNSNNFFSTGSEQPFFKSILHPKLTINAPNDIYEKEADRVADAVMRMPDSQVQMQPMVEEEEELQIQSKRGDQIQMKQQVPELQRMCPHCRERAKQGKPLNCPDCEKELQMKPDIQLNRNGRSYAGAAIKNKLQMSNGTGNPLPSKTLNELGSKMGADFNGVKVHTDAKAAQLNRQLGARAFTYGRDIYFNRGEYNPSSQGGKHLLAHELTHVVQQRGNISPRLQRVCVNNPTTAPSVGMVGCSTENTRPAHPSVEIDFTNNTNIAPVSLSTLSSIAAQWHANGRSDDLRIDGFASCEGGTILNWQLSCNRATAIENELKSTSGGPPGIPATARFIKFAHGETEEFSPSTLEDNRKCLITLQPSPTPLPTTIPPLGASDFQINRIPNSTQTHIYFAAGSSSLTADAIVAINSLKSASPSSVRLIGFASMEEPTSLAQDRANAVQTRLAVAPNSVIVPNSDVVGNAAATSTRSNFARARSVEILVGGATPSTLDCTARDPSPPHNLINPPTAPCASMDPPTLTDFNAALVIANEAMIGAMNAINPSHADYNPALIQRFFGNNDPATLAVLSTNMANLQSHVSGLPAITQCGGQCDTGGCGSGNVIAYNHGVDASSTMTLCVPVFKSMNSNDQARNLIHESAHGTTPLGGSSAPTEGTADVAYRHERMLFHLSTADRLRNSDSYALFALYAKEIHDTHNPSAVPSGISVPETDTITGITGANRAALELAVAQLEKRLSWAVNHTSQLFGKALEVRTGAIPWSSTWAEDYMSEAATMFPLTAPSTPPNIDDMTILAGIIERYKIMKVEINRNLTITTMPSGVINWPVAGGFASDTLQIGPDFFRATAENQISLLLEHLAHSTPDVETAFIPAYVSFAKFIHENAT